MIIESVRARNFLSHEDSTVDFTEARMWLICGENGAGKSALFDAVEYALYGQHRGDRQNAQLLVRQGAARATIELVFRLDGRDGRRYRTLRQIDARRGNLSGELAEWSEEKGEWYPKNVGGGVQAVWDWLRPRLPDHNLFRSAIYLRQSHTAHFLDCTSGERIKRFAALVDLRRYTLLSQAAQQRGATARQRKSETQGKLDELGDVSEEAVRILEERLVVAADMLSAAHQHVEQATAVTRGAEAWQRLRDEQQRKAQQRTGLLALLEDETAIRCDASRVARWDVSAPKLNGYWRERAAAEQRRSEAQQANSDAGQAEENQARLVNQRDQAVEHQRAIGEELPAARHAAEAAHVNVRDLALEVDIARGRAEAEAAEREVARHEGKDRELAEWRALQEALPGVRALAKAREKLADAEAAVETAQGKLALAQDKAVAAAEAEAGAAACVQTAELEVDATRGRLSQLDQEVARLEGRVEGHRRLRGDERECPVCARALDEAAHAHVQAAVAGERATLECLKADQAAAKAAQAAAERELKSAGQQLQRAQNALYGAEQAVALDRQRADQSEATREQADLELAWAREVVASGNPYYAQQVDAATAAWLEVEEPRVATRLRQAEQDARALADAQAALGKAQARLDTLRGRRASTAAPLGDEQSEDRLRDLVAAAGETAQQWGQRVEALEAEAQHVQQRVRDLVGQVAALEEQARGARARAAQAEHEAAEADGEAARLAAELGSEWTNCLADHEAYQAERQEVGRRRPNAERVSALDQARGQLHLVDEELRDIAQAMAQLDSVHDIPLGDAREREAAARAEAQEAAITRAQRENDLRDLEERRARAEACQQEINAATAEAMTYSELAELLKDGGPVQTMVAEQQQQSIAYEVNEVLARLSDPLRVRLGVARRAGSTHPQDIHILDTSDPAGVPRYFEFLSGGEQFRVALALALALHHRVGKQAGTLIVDEGFGMLDGHWRDALALQMGDTSQGILRLGLAESILICSHSTEVQRHFPYRWLVRKRDGIATVCRPDETGEEMAR